MPTSSIWKMKSRSPAGVSLSQFGIYDWWKFYVGDGGCSLLKRCSCSCPVVDWRIGARRTVSFCCATLWRSIWALERIIGWIPFPSTGVLTAPWIRRQSLRVTATLMALNLSDSARVLPNWQVGVTFQFHLEKAIVLGLFFEGAPLFKAASVSILKHLSLEIINVLLLLFPNFCLYFQNQLLRHSLRYCIRAERWPSNMIVNSRSADVKESIASQVHKKNPNAC